MSFFDVYATLGINLICALMMTCAKILNNLLLRLYVHCIAEIYMPIRFFFEPKIEGMLVSAAVP